MDDDRKVEEAAESVAEAEATLAAALEALRLANAKIDASSTTEAAAMLASSAVKDLGPSDLDEIRAIRSSPPRTVQQVVCCVCSILACGEDEDGEIVGGVGGGAGGGGLLPTLGAVPPSLLRWQKTLPKLRKGAKGVVAWELAQKRVGQKGFKQALLNFDARRLLAPEAAAVLDAVQSRIAVTMPSGSGSVSRRRSSSSSSSSGLLTGLASVATAALQQTSKASSSPTGSATASPSASPSSSPSSSLSSSLSASPSTSPSASPPALLAPGGTLPPSSPQPPAHPLPLSRASLAGTVARARRASYEAAATSAAATSAAAGGSPMPPLTWEEASHGSRTIGALFLWCSRVLANAEQLRTSQEAEVRRRRDAEIEAGHRAAAAAEARAALELARAAHARALARAEEAERRAAAASQAAEAERARQAAMRAAEEAARGAAELELEARRRSGERAVLEVVDVVIHQKVEFRAGSAVVEEVNVPALICVADLMLTNPTIKVGVEAAPGIELGAERAEGIVQWLVDQGGVSVSRLRTMPPPAAAVGRARASAGGGGGGGGTWHIRFNVLAEIKISDQLAFGGGSDTLVEDSKQTLRSVASVLQTRHDVKRLTIEGHTCSDGPLIWNEQLSRERAEAVRRFLTHECGVATDRLKIVGHGPHKAITDDYLHRRRNRRVEFLVM